MSYDRHTYFIVYLEFFCFLVDVHDRTIQWSIITEYATCQR